MAGKKAKKTKSSDKKKISSGTLSGIKKSIADKLKDDTTSKTDSNNVPSLLASFNRTRKMLKGYWRSIFKVTAVYGVLYFAFVRVLTRVNFDELKASVEIAIAGSRDTLWSKVAITGALFGESARLDSQETLVYALVTVMSSLAIIWVLRCVWAKERASVKEAYYQGMYPLVPYSIIFGIIIIQMIPFSVSAFIFQTAFNNGLTVSLAEKFLFVSLFAFGTLVSLYFVVGSLMALYAVTIPGVTPMQALKTTKRMLKGRRIAVLKQILVFVVVSASIALAMMLAVIWLLPSLAVLFTALILVLMLPWAHLYMYGLYRDLIDG